MVVASPTPNRTAADPSRARRPDASGVVVRDGVRIAWDRYGPAGGRATDVPTILLLPTWSIVHSRVWKHQVPYLARSYRVVTFDGRGNGRSDRPAEEAAYADAEFAADALAVMDATGTPEAVIVALSAGAAWALILAAQHPERVSGAVFLGAALPLGQPRPARQAAMAFDDELPSYDGWAKFNRHYWRRHHRDFLEFFFEQCFSEPHSTKPIEDCVSWGLETDGQTLVLTHEAPGLAGPAETGELARSVRCPVLVIHGTDDRIRPYAQGEELARLTGGALLAFEGSGHIVQAREPVRTNLAIREFVESLAGRRR